MIINLYRVLILGQMEGDLKVIGNKIICMEEEFILGKMEGGMKENT